MDSGQVAELVNGSGGFAGDLHTTTAQEMLRRGTVLRVEKGGYVTRRGEKKPRLCITLSGSVRLTAFTEDGREMLSLIIRPGDCWGVHPCLGGYKETNDGIAETDAVILSLRPETVEDLMWTRQDFQRAMVKLLCKRLNLAVSLAEQLGSWTARERVAWRLLLLANAFDMRKVDTVNPRITTSQETLASMVHLSRQHTNVILKALKSDGVVDLRYGVIEILDVDRLRSEMRRAQ